MVTVNPDGAPKRKRLGAEQRREMIARAALKLFAERGYERTTTKEIAREAGISEGTIFKYFPTKHDLLLAFFSREVFAPLAEIFTLEEPIDDYRVMHAFITDRFRLWHRHRKLMKVIIGEALFNRKMVAHLNRLTGPALGILKDYFRRRIRDGAFREVDVDVVGQALISYLLTYFFRWVLLERDDDDEAARMAVVDELTGLFLYGVVKRPEPEQTHA
ncbi:MAG: TetR/AcrR family transcriptional regulator [Armatimonadota bacterium]